MSDSDDESTNLINQKLKKIKPEPAQIKNDQKTVKPRIEKTPTLKHMSRRIGLNQPVLSRKYTESKK